MRGLKKEETEKFCRYFELLQQAAAEEGIVFFMYTKNGESFETEELEGQNLMGWLIPAKLADAFENFWDQDLDDLNFGVWDEYFGFVEWKQENGALTFEFV